jgi:mRNA interferase MazF
MSEQAPCCGEVWMVELGATRGHEQAGRRPGLVVSMDGFNHGPAGLVVLVPLTTRERGIPWHVAVSPPEGGLKRPSFIKCEDIRSISRTRLVRQLGDVSATTMAKVRDRLRILLEL